MHTVHVRLLHLWRPRCFNHIVLSLDPSVCLTPSFKVVPCTSFPVVPFVSSGSFSKLLISGCIERGRCRWFPPPPSAPEASKRFFSESPPFARGLLPADS
uniref:Uncharacterized protein n=1 Tax=Anguilla anguilla TaxID=7936 RepID=A0A0E9X8K6_ANGAN